MSWAPMLRPEVEVKPREEGGVHLYDPLTDRQIDVTPASAALIARFDGTTTLDALLEGVEGDERRRLRRTVKMLQLLLFLRGSGERVIARLAEVRAGNSLPHSILAGAQFECQGSGQCCQNYVFGPLTDADIARLDTLDIEGQLPDLGPGPYWATLERQDGRHERYLKSVDERCIFLEGGHRCRLHARFGAESKPGLCRLYPLEQFATVDGIRLYDKGSCASFAVSSRSGPSLAESLPQLLPILAPTHHLQHPIVQLAEGLPIDYGFWLGFADAAMRFVENGQVGPADTLRAIGGGLQRVVAAVEGYELAPGQPDQAVLSVLAEDARTWLPPPADPTPGAGALGAMLGVLLDVLANGIHARVHQPGGKWWSARLLREVTQIVHLAQGLAGHLADPTQPLDPYYAGIAAVTTSDPAVEDVLRRSLRQQLFGARALVSLRVDAGLLRLALIQLLATTGAKMVAAASGSKTYRATDLSYAHMLAVRTLDLDGPERLITEWAGASMPILDALPSLVP